MSTATPTTSSSLRSENRTLDIDGMTGDTCVQKVTGALKGVQEVSTHSVQVGSAEIASDQAGCDAACSAINRAGYKSRERGGSNGTNSHAAQVHAGNSSATKHPQDQKSGAGDAKSRAADVRAAAGADMKTGTKDAARDA